MITLKLNLSDDQLKIMCQALDEFEANHYESENNDWQNDINSLIESIL